LQNELEGLNVLEKIISAISNLDITKLSNKIQKEYREQHENKELYYSDHFLLESVKERLDLYNISNRSDKQALANIIIMLCIHLAKIKNLYISNDGITEYAKNQDQQDISQVFRSLEKNKK
ncbi:24011_t:CDS:1, partial [Cetraspora pellucida]